MVDKICSTTPEAKAKAERRLRKLFSSFASSFSVQTSPSDATVAALMRTSVPDQVEKIQAERAIRYLAACLVEIGEERGVDTNLSLALFTIALTRDDGRVSSEQQLREWLLEYRGSLSADQHLRDGLKRIDDIVRRLSRTDHRRIDLFAAGQGLPMIGKLLDHTQVQTTARYAYLAWEPVKNAADLVSDRLQAGLDGRSSVVDPFWT